MKKTLLMLLIALLGTTIFLVSALAESDGIVRYTGVVTQDVPMRAEMSKSSKRVSSVKKGEAIEIISIENGWLLVLKDEVEGYVFGESVENINLVPREGEATVEAYDLPDSGTFQPIFTARVTKQSSLRSNYDDSGKLLATFYPKDYIELGEVGTEYAIARKGDKLGYILTRSLNDLDMTSPYLALPSGAKQFPYAATALEAAPIMGTIYSKLGELQVIPEGAVVAVGEPDESGEVLLSYKRTVGRMSASQLKLEKVMPMDAAQPGDLISVFATFFVADNERSLMAGRLHNLTKGVDLLDGKVLTPGEKFSFNDIAAPYNAANGYEVGPIINYTSDKKTGFGGGICQVSTTLFNVLLQLPMEIVRTQPHSSRGIDYAPVGFDAAVGAGNLDFIFVNSAPYAIRMSLNVWDGVITVRLYRES